MARWRRGRPRAMWVWIALASLCVIAAAFVGGAVTGQELAASDAREANRVRDEPAPAQLEGRVFVYGDSLVVQAEPYLTGVAKAFDLQLTTRAFGGTTAVASEGLPVPDASSSALEPADVGAARAAVVQAFNDAYGGGRPESVRNAAIQDGSTLQTLRQDVVAEAQRYGYTSEQLDGTSIEVLSVTFIDEMHAAVRFTIAIPDHGDVLVDRVGYATFEGGRWKVALRTACDLLSLNGLRRQCPPP